MKERSIKFLKKNQIEIILQLKGTITKNNSLVEGLKNQSLTGRRKNKKLDSSREIIQC